MERLIFWAMDLMEEVEEAEVTDGRAEEVDLRPTVLRVDWKCVILVVVGEVKLVVVGIVKLELMK